ncbi:MAG TPA: hypothetical protein VGF99_22545 [Myxococcota bacterium]
MFEDDAETLPPHDDDASNELTEAVQWLREHGVITTPVFETLFR